MVRFQNAIERLYIECCKLRGCDVLSDKEFAKGKQYIKDLCDDKANDEPYCQISLTDIEIKSIAREIYEKQN